MTLTENAEAVAFRKYVVTFLFDIEVTNGIWYFALPNHKKIVKLSFPCDLYHSYLTSHR